MCQCCNEIVDDFRLSSTGVLRSRESLPKVRLLPDVLPVVCGDVGLNGLFINVEEEDAPAAVRSKPSPDGEVCGEMVKFITHIIMQRVRSLLTCY